MKKAMLMLMVSVAMGASAQDVMEPTPSAGIQSQESEIQNKQSSWGIEYDVIEDGGQLGMDWVVNHLVIGGSYGWGKKTDYVKENNGWDVHLGGNYRYFVGGDVFYVEGRLLVGYANWSYKYLAGQETETHTSGIGRMERTYTTTKDIWDKKSNGDIYLGVTPRAGLNFNGISVFIGYRWNFTKFKFSKEYTSDFFTVGVCTVF